MIVNAFWKQVFSKKKKACVLTHKNTNKSIVIWAYIIDNYTKGKQYR
jgi:hypothetical protein